MSNQFSADALDVLAYFSRFAVATTLYPDQPICVMNENRSLFAWADVELGLEGVDAEEGLPIYDLGSLNNIAKMFSKHEDHNVSIEEDKLRFKAGRFKQDFYLSEPELLDGQFPKIAKIEALMASDFIAEFSLSEADLAMFMTGLGTTKADTVILSATDGAIQFYGKNVDESGTEERNGSTFSMETDAVSEVDFRVGFARAVFMLLPGDYTVKLNDKFIAFIGETVHAILPLAGWSEVAEH